MIDRAGWPFILGALALAVALGLWLGVVWAAPAVILAAFFAFFFRDPHRDVPTDPRLVVSPADGRVMIVGAPARRRRAARAVAADQHLSVPDGRPHQPRPRLPGAVTRVEYHPGKFLPAYRVEAGELNEWTEVWFDQQRHVVVCRQIVGILARRIVTPADRRAIRSAGERFGIMKFGSRIDLFLPLSATIAGEGRRSRRRRARRRSRHWLRSTSRRRGSSGSSALVSTAPPAREHPARRVAAAEPVHARQPVLRLGVRRPRHARRARDRRAVHRRRRWSSTCSTAASRA